MILDLKVGDKVRAYIYCSEDLNGYNTFRGNINTTIVSFNSFGKICVDWVPPGSGLTKWQVYKDTNCHIDDCEGFGKIQRRLK
jgi:hypothetical protein